MSINVDLSIIGPPGVLDILQLIHITSGMQDIAVNACKYFLHIDIQMKYFKMLHFVYNNHLDLWYA